jgi:hypothetical protein
MSPLDKPSRREFLVTTSSPLWRRRAFSRRSRPPVADARYSLPRHYSFLEELSSGPQRTLTGDRATQIAMPWEGSEPGASV